MWQLVLPFAKTFTDSMHQEMDSILFYHCYLRTMEMILILMFLRPMVLLIPPAVLSHKTLYLVEPTMPPHLLEQILSLIVHMHLLKVAEFVHQTNVQCIVIYISIHYAVLI